jgi:hypothetical protein
MDKDPFVPHEELMDDYLHKTSLSPWVPLPEIAARKIFDLAQPVTEQDFHVDLGSGDGRVCFMAVDYGRVAHSLGVDIDAAIVERAKNRLARRHTPTREPNVEFVVADLLPPIHDGNSTTIAADNEKHDALWNRIANATIISMFMETSGLERLRPLLERYLVGKSCRIVTCGYAMPGWESTVDEVVLGTTLHLYLWGSVESPFNSTVNTDTEQGDSSAPLAATYPMQEPSLLTTTASSTASTSREAHLRSMLEANKMSSGNKRFDPPPFPDWGDQEENDDFTSDEEPESNSDDDDDNEEEKDEDDEEEEKEKDKKEVKIARKKKATPCSSTKEKNKEEDDPKKE